MTSTLLILGAGGHGKSVAYTAELMKIWDNIVFADDRYPSMTTISEYPIISSIQEIEYIKNDATQAIVAIGNNAVRKKLQDRLKKLSIPLATVIHPSVILNDTVMIGEGSVILAGCVLGIDVKIGDGVILNIGTMVDHDVIIGNYAHLSVGVNITGGKNIEENIFLDAGTSINH